MENKHVDVFSQSLEQWDAALLHNECSDEAWGLEQGSAISNSPRAKLASVILLLQE